MRLEAKLCLYGNDIDATPPPLEVGLGWVTKPKAGHFGNVQQAVTDLIWRLQNGIRTVLPLAVSQILIVPSELALATRPPSLPKLTLFTEAQ